MIIKDALAVITNSEVRPMISTEPESECDETRTLRQGLHEAVVELGEAQHQIENLKTVVSELKRELMKAMSVRI